MSTLSETEFKALNRLLGDVAGFQLGPAKKLLVAGQLAPRLQAHRLARYGDYLELIAHDAAERQLALDLVTATDTPFFSESRHFAFLTEQVAPRLRDEGAVRVWSAACASGEEPYTIAMVLLASLGHDRFEIIASDINTQALATAREARYGMDAARDIPWAFRSSYCVKGEGPHAGSFLMDRPVGERVRFEAINLHAPLPDVGLCDVIFLRTVISAFPLDTRRSLVERVRACLKPDGWLIIGESENLHGLPLAIKMTRPSIYQHAGAR